VSEENKVLKEKVKKLKRKNVLLEQSLQQNHIIHKKFNDAMALLKKKDEELQELNDNLERKIKERTVELERVYNQEHQLKEILQMTTDVNDYLVGAMNFESIAKNAVHRIAEHSTYHHCCFGKVENNEISLLYESLNYEDLHGCKTDQDCKNSELFAGLHEAVASKSTVIKTDLTFPSSKMKLRRKNDAVCKSSISLPLFFDKTSKVFGVINIFTTHDKIEKEEKSILEKLASDISLAMNMSEHRSIMKTLEAEKMTNYEETILAFVDMIEQRDSYTAGHTVRVAEYCRLIASSMGIEEQEIQKLEKAAILHDIGKVVTPDTILLKPDKLSSIEYELIKQHATSGYKMLSKIKMYEELADIILHHHEHYDGKGYPDGLKGSEISMLTHILIVSDSFDAMTTNRIYKGRQSPKEALEEIEMLAFSQFHPIVVRHAKNVLMDVDIIDEGQLPNNFLEQQRFSYFFNDSLTTAYNEHYLNLILNKNMEEYVSLHILRMLKFSEYNKELGWSSGNKLLQKFADFCSKKFSDALIFRYHGDSFVILNKEVIEIGEHDFSGFEDNIGVEVEKFDIVEFVDATL